jgi:hypothetical protein
MKMPKNTPPKDQAAPTDPAAEMTPLDAAIARSTGPLPMPGAGTGPFGTALGDDAQIAPRRVATRDSELEGRRMADREQIARGADLTEHDIATLAADAIEVSWWCMRNKIKRTDQQEQVRQALRARLGRRPLIIAVAHG